MIRDSTGVRTEDARSVADTSTTSGSEDSATKGARRRRALAAILEHHQLTPTMLAHMIDMQRPNAIYNFLHGRTDGLSLDTIERILMVLPDVSFEELVGWSPRRGVSPPRSRKPVSLCTEITVTVEVSANGQTKRFGLQPEEEG